MQYQPDITIRKPDGEPIAIIEVRNRQHLSEDIAVDLRNSVVARDISSNVRYIVLVSQDTGYLWLPNGRDNGSDRPVAQFPMQDVILRYFGVLPEGKRLDANALEFIVFRWLLDIVSGGPSAWSEAEYVLDAAGFMSSVRDAEPLMEKAS